MNTPIDPTMKNLRLILQSTGDRGSRFRFGLRAGTTAALLMTGLIFAFRALLYAQSLNLTGTYMADDGGIYYVQQSGSTLWWAGMSLDSNLAPDLQWHRGLNFSNVFKGTINSGPLCDASPICHNTISGEWTDVTRGTSLNHGTLTVRFDNSSGVVQFTKVVATGGFGATTWTQTAPLDDTRFDGQLSTIYSKFDVVHKNGGETLVHDLKPYRDSTVFYGQLMTSAMDTLVAQDTGIYSGKATHEPPLVNYPTWGTSARSYSAFAGENGDDDGGKDGDFDLRVKIDLNKLEPDFSVYGWENHDQAPDIILSKLNGQLVHNVLGLGGHFAYMHPEAIEYGVASGLSLLPGWADLSSNSILVNGRPINGQITGPNSANSPCNFVQPCPYTDPSNDPLMNGVQIGNLRLVAGTYIRVTGALVLDCGHGISTPCFDDPSAQTEVAVYQNQEIHPVYSIDILNSPFTPEDIGVSARANLTGTWGGDDGSTYYVRQIGNTVWLFGQLRDRQPNQQGTSYDLIGTRQVAAAGLLVGSPLCGSTMRCWMFGTVIKGTISNNADGSSIIQGDWAGVPQSTSPGSTGGSVTFSVDKYHKVITPQTMQVIFPNTVQKMYEPVTDILPPQSTLTIGTPHYSTSGGQVFVTTATPFTLSAIDGDSGVQNVWYRAFPSGSASQPAYTPVIGSSASFMVSGRDGTYEVDTYATDNAGNDEAPHSQLVYLDSTAPMATIAQPTATQYLHSDSFTISYSVSDGAGSGVKSATPNIDGLTTLYDGTTSVTVAKGVTVKLLTELSLGTHTFNVDSVDNLGNAGRSTVTFSIVVTADSIKDDVRYFYSIGAITQDEATSLLSKLNSAAKARAKGNCANAATIYTSFISEVQAQSGKKIDPIAAPILVADAQYLIAHCP